MEDLSHIIVPKIPVKEGIPAFSEEVMGSFSDQETTGQAAKLMGIAEEDGDGGS